ncbi:MAG: glutamate racemase [Chloroflexi bacterium]|nr:MAG: glutamate racemase [Chloroflexota bacterium]MBL1195747.1 glutamate racemase [Chloroflexota bacterium]NOH13036.1 glutamate racemase [Chloroflexota bacterium]
MSLAAPIGIFDSGVGGLSVLRAIRQQHPSENLIYLADQAHVPYGPRGLRQVQAFSEGITRYLLGQGAKLIVIACNTASAAALHHLRATFPDVPFVGMEPAVKPAAEHTNSGVVGVLATPTTFEGELYASVVERFAQDVTVLQDTCAGLVGQIEQGKLDGPEARRILQGALEPMLESRLDTVVLGCTHYPFVIPLIQDIVGPQVNVIDPSPAIARQVGRLLEKHTLQNPARSIGVTRYLTSGDPVNFQELIKKLLEQDASAQMLSWQDDLELVPQIS